MKTKENPEFDELLNAFVDGELTIRQRTEVKRMAANDPDIAQRLRQLQKCRTLISSLPIAQAPAGILDNIKTSLETVRQPIEYEQTFDEEPAVTRKLPVQRVLATAAMIGLVAVLAAVFYVSAPTQTVTEGPVISGDQQPEDGLGAGTAPGVAASAGFSGRLELKTSELIAVDAFINRMIEDNGLSDSPTLLREPNRRVYSLECNEQYLNRVLADLGSIWDQFDSATLFVNTDVFAEQIKVSSVTIEQISEIAGQVDSGNAVEVAKDIAILNNMAGRLPGREIISALEISTDGLIAIRKPVLTSIQKPVQQSVTDAQSGKIIHLTVVVSR